LSKSVKALPSLLDALRKALAPDDDIQAQKKAFDLGCSLLEELVDSIVQHQPEIDDVQKLTTGVDISIPKGQYTQFINDEVELLKNFGFNEKDLNDCRSNLSAFDDGLDTLRFDSRELFAALETFRDLICQVKTLAADELIANPKKLIQTSLSGVLDVGMIGADMVTGTGVIVAGVGAITTVWGAFLAGAALLPCLGSIKAGYLSLNTHIGLLRDLIKREQSRREAARKMKVLKDRKPPNPLTHHHNE
jgi:hypothetical protein